MFILLFSDSHGNWQEMKKVISTYPETSVVIHLGDCVKDVNQVSGFFSNIRFEYVAGNNDFHAGVGTEKMVTLSGKKILLTHGHTYGVKSSLKKLAEKGRELNADAVFYGHTHLLNESYDEGLLLLNPGSMGRPCIGKGPTYCEVKIEEKGFRVKVKTLI